MAEPIEEGSISKGGSCHCGKVGLYAVPRHGRGRENLEFFCGDHKDEADDLMRKVHSLSSMRRERRYDAAVEHEATEDVVYNPEGRFTKGGMRDARRRH